MSFAIHMDQLERKFSLAQKTVNVPGGETISQKYRGYEWHDLVVPIELQLDLRFSSVAYQYCDSGRYLFNERVLELPDKMTPERARGKLLDKALLGMINESRNYLKSKSNPHCLEIHPFFQKLVSANMSKFAKQIEKEYAFLTPTDKSSLLNLCKGVMEFEYGLIVSRIQYLVSKTRDITMESLINESLPVLIENRITARDMGFSEKMTPDFLFFNSSTIGEFKGFKFDPKDQSYRIAVTGYALAYEKTTGKDVDVGCVLFMDADKTKETPLFELDVFVLKDQYRQAFISKRQIMLEMVHDKRDPGLASRCLASCPYLEYCKPDPANIIESE